MLSFKAFFLYLKNFIKEDFNFFVYLYTALFLFLAIRYNYQTQFLTKFVKEYNGSFKGIGYGYLFFAIAYYGVAIPKLIVARRLLPLGSFSFYARSSLLILAVSVALFSDTRDWIKFAKILWDFPLDESEVYFVLFNFGNFKFFFVWVMASGLLYIFTRRYYKKPYWYGCTWKGFNLRLYILMFMFMVPLLYYASHLDSFLSVYPLLDMERVGNIYGLSSLELLVIFEIIYALTFVGTEILFRGAFVLGLLDLIENHGVLPMVSIYCFIHFNKPMLEAISSIFGGYILGILAIATFNVMGGILIHVAVAWGMDFFAFARKSTEG